jgi:hypothetical protein
MSFIKRYAKGRRPMGELNPLEKKFEDEILRPKKESREIEWYLYEGLRLRLAKRLTYCPDFLVMTNEGYLECWEVKGVWLESAKNKVKVAASIFPFRFVGAMRKKGEWQFEEFSCLEN